MFDPARPNAETTESVLVARLREKLQRALDAATVEIVDESWKHAGHVAMAGVTPEATHLNITIVSSRFNGVSLIDQHRMVNEILKEARETHLHALQLKTIPSSQAV
jgi:stress-induced morphogen